jgi:hypothetical protein
MISKRDGVNHYIVECLAVIYFGVTYSASLKATHLADFTLENIRSKNSAELVLQ